LKKIGLNDREWHLAWYCGEEWFIRNDYRNERLIGFIPAQVPGVVQEDLLEQEIIEDLHKDMDSMKAEWVPQRNWLYKKFLNIGTELKGKRIRLHYEGVDYSAKYYINGIFLGQHEGMFEPVEFDITQHIKFGESNIIAVAIDEAPREQCQVGYTSKVKTTKARVNYWWDFAQRIIPLGIWDEVYIIVDDGCSIDNLRIMTELSEDFEQGEVRTEVEITADRTIKGQAILKVKFASEIFSEESLTLYLRKGSNLININTKLYNPKFWWPNGYGEQNQYSAEIILIEEDKELYSHEEKFGFRSVKLMPNDDFEVAPNYKFNINGKSIFIKGWNWVPIDLLYGRDKTDRYSHLITLAKKANVNMLRVWGGGLIEKEIFYKLCDEQGIMIWQEFNQSSSGIENKPGDEKWYIDMFKKYAITAVKKRRNHAALVIWCGGNELISDSGLPLDNDTPLLAEFKKVVEQYGNNHIYLPTSPFGKIFGLNIENTKRKGELYDIHGPWAYQGVKLQYELYNENSCALQSEFGAEGTVDYDILKSFMSEDKMWPPTRENRTWSHHGAWFINYDMMCKTFGELADIKEYVKLSHYLQAEGLRYAVEANRRRTLQCGGTLPWQFNEPFPNGVGTASVNYYGVPKMAYYYVKKAYEPLALSLKYSSQAFVEEISFELWINSSHKVDSDSEAYVNAYNLRGELLYKKTYKVDALEAEKAVKLAMERIWTEENLVIVRINSSLNKDYNEYIFVKGENLEGLRYADKTNIQVEKYKEKLQVKNTGERAALFVYVNKPADNNYLILLPQEEREIQLLSSAEDIKVTFFNQ
jgi:beta-mannosidase